MPTHEGVSLAQRIADQIAMQIIRGDLLEGEHIQELRIAEEMQVSRGSVREALLLLERTQLIQIFPRRGAMVSEMSSTQVQALFDIISLLLGHMVELMSRQLQLSQKLYLSHLSKQAQQAMSQHQIEQFYDLIFMTLQDCLSSLESCYVLKFYQELLPSLRRCYFLTLNTEKHELEHSYALFNLTIVAILSQKAQQATLFMHDFCRHLQQLVLQSLTRMKQIELAWEKRSRR